MMAPTSVSSRLSAMPMTPSPKSSISLSIASVRPSILATPSEISRTVPMFCLAAEVMALLIWASISWRIELISFSNYGDQYLLKSFDERIQTRLHTAVIHVAAHRHAHAADQGG